MPLINDQLNLHKATDRTSSKQVHDVNNSDTTNFKCCKILVVLQPRLIHLADKHRRDRLRLADVHV